MELKPERFIPDFTFFYKNDEKLLCGQTIFEKLKIYSYDIKENTLEDVQVEPDWHTFMPNPSEDIVAFSKGDHINGQLFIYNLKTKKKQPISPIMEDASYLKWDSAGKMLAARLNRNKIAVVDITAN